MIVYDVEVLRGPDDTEGGWDNPEGMGFGTAVAYVPGDGRKAGRYYFCGPDEELKLVTALELNSPVITFNGVKFDNRVLLGNEKGKAPDWTDIDLLVDIVKARFPGAQTVAEAEKAHGRFVVHNGTCNLGALCTATLNQGKIGHGANAPTLIQDGKWAAVYEYNLHDVQLTWQLYEFGRRYGYILAPRKKNIYNDVVKIPVGW